MLQCQQGHNSNMSTISFEMEHDSLHYDSIEEASNNNCMCSLVGLRRNIKVLDYLCEEEDSEEELFEINLKKSLDTISEDCESSVFSFDIHTEKKEEDVVYVAVNHTGESSMEALLWTLNHVVTPSSTTLYLIHVFPIIRLIPSPFGKFPRSHVNSEYVNFYLSREKDNRRMLLKRFIDLCIDSKVKVEMILIEGDNVAKAILDLVKDLSIRKLVIGTTKSNLRRRNGIADKVLKNAPETCDVKIICEGKEVIDQMIGCSESVSQKEDEPRGFVPLMRFMHNPIWSFGPRF